MNEVLNYKNWFRGASTAISAFALITVSCTAGCSPRVGIEVPDKPVTINLNVKIDHEVRVKVERDLDQVLSKDSKLF